jgi:hypothetical protein
MKLPKKIFMLSCSVILYRLQLIEGLVRAGLGQAVSAFSQGLRGADSMLGGVGAQVIDFNFVGYGQRTVGY